MAGNFTYDKALGEQSPQKDSQEQPMATVEAEGREYLGELRFPTLDLTLPVLSQCSEENLKTAPCRYLGSLSGGDLIVAGHNYQSHFGRLDQLSPGDPVTFTVLTGKRTLLRSQRPRSCPAPPWRRWRRGSGT